MTELQTIADWLARRDVPELNADSLHDLDVVVLCGSAVLGTLDTVERALRLVPGAALVISGGRGHSTAYLEAAIAADQRYRDIDTHGRSEAAILGDALARRGLEPARLAMEERSTNCGENASFTVARLHELGWPMARLLLVQDPLMQRRTHACFIRALADSDAEVVSHAAFRPVAGPVWSEERFEEMVLGEVRRLHDDEHGYGPRGAGYIDHVDVPDAVLSAYRRRLQGGATARAEWDPAS